MADENSSDSPEDPAPIKRDKDFSRWKQFKDDIGELYNDIVDAYDDKSDQVENIVRYWQVFNTELTANQAYNGNSQIYLPLVRDVIEARVTRFVNMLFPKTGQHVDVIAYGADQPVAIMALLNHYVKRSDLRLIAPALLRNGEVEGHYSIYTDWQTTTRFVTRKIEKNVEVDGIPDPDMTYLDIDEEEVEDSFPAVDVIAAADLVVSPVTCNNVEEADFVSVRRRYTKSKIRQLIRDGVLNEKSTKPLLDVWADWDLNYNEDVEKKKINAAGIKGKRGKFVEVFEVWRKFKIDGNRRWCRLYLWGDNYDPLAFTINPNWNDRCSVISMPRTKVSGSFWGKSPVDAVEQLQYAANDACNMAWDSAQYSLLPIIMTDPEKNPNMSSMILGLAAIWQTNPNDTQIVNFPQLWRDALEIVGNAKSQIMSSFGLNPAMMPQGVASSRATQAQVAQEAAVAIESTANEVTTLEEGIFSPMLERFFEADQQFRKTPIQVKVYGQMGVAAKMTDVPTFAWDDRYEFRWSGVQTFRTAQDVQQMIAGMNILRSLPPVLPDGKRIELSPIVEVLVENVFGARLAGKILLDVKDQLSMDPTIENQIMAGGMQMPVHQFDDDQEHLKSHLPEADRTGDPTGSIRVHIQQHMAQMQTKQQQPGQPGGASGVPGGAGQPGVAGTPVPGSQPQAPTGAQQPPGAIHPDQMQDPSQMPRKATMN